jgi:hypothetical protein
MIALNGIHIGCCHTIVSVLVGAVMIGLTIQIVSFPLYHIGKHFANYNHTNPTHRWVWVAISFFLTMYLVELYDSWRFRQYLNRVEIDMGKNIGKGSASEGGARKIEGSATTVGKEHFRGEKNLRIASMQKDFHENEEHVNK